MPPDPDPTGPAAPQPPKPPAAAPSAPAGPAAKEAPPLVVAHWPHLRGGDSTARIMWSVVATLAPALVASGYFFGWRSYLLIALAVATSVVTEGVIQKLRKVPVTLRDGSAVVTGLLVAFCLPAQARWFVPMTAAFVAIAIAKHCFGGLGCNIWNPALIGRAFVQLAYPTDLNPSKYPLLQGGHFWANVGTVTAPGVSEGVEAVTAATPMANLKHLAEAAAPMGEPAKEFLAGMPSLSDMVLGNRGGDIGESCVVLLVIGAAYLIYRGWVRWQIPATYLAAVALGALVLPIPYGSRDGVVHWPVFLAHGPDVAAQFVAYHLLGGGLVLGAFFMATDMVTSPITSRGMLLFGAGCGLLTILIRLYGGYPEAVCYSILLMNTVVPLIDRYSQNRIFGHKR